MNEFRFGTHTGQPVTAPTQLSTGSDREGGRACGRRHGAQSQLFDTNGELSALRTQQIVAFESGVPNTIDPLAGSYFIESLTDEIEKRAWEYLDKIDALGGMLKAIERGFVQQEIQNAAYEQQKLVESGEATVVGVNRFTQESSGQVPIQ